MTRGKIPPTPPDDDRVIWLMMPGGDRNMIVKSLKYRPDVIIPCLEDGVAYDDEAKKAAREVLADVLGGDAFGSRDVLVYPRINHPSGPYWRDDVDVVVGTEATGIVIPKTESADEVRTVAEYVAAAEARAGRAEGAVRIVAMIETARGVLRAEEIASAHERVRGLLFGREDYSASVGLMRRHADSLAEGSPELLFARSAVVTAAQAAGVEAIDGAAFTLVDEEYIARDASLTARLGFTGKLAAHPAHVAGIRAAYTPDPGDLEAARKMLELERESAAAGTAAVGGVDGMEVTPPVIAQAKLLVRRAAWAEAGLRRGGELT
ncbi:MAG TPA: CoA ester lyase [Spirillospora sp.]